MGDGKHIFSGGGGCKRNMRRLYNIKC